MDFEHRRHPTRPLFSPRFLMLLLLNALKLHVHAQQIPESTSTSFSTTRQSTTIRSSSNSPSSSSSSTRSSTSPTAGTHHPSYSPQPDNPDHRGLSNQANGFYYIFAGLFLLFFAICLWIVHVRRRKRRTMEIRAAGQDALALDIDGLPYPNGRRWAGRGGVFSTRRDEGLNERGEAPPPYKPPDQDAERAGRPPGAAIPLQTLGGPYSGQPKPPEYQQQLFNSPGTGEQSSSDPGARGRMG